MAGFNAVKQIYVDPTVHYDALEGILEPVLNLQGTWDPAYGHVTRGHMLKRVTGVTVQGIANVTVDRPMLVGKVTAVSGNVVTLAAGAAAGQGLVGKTLTKVTAAGVVSALTVTVSSLIDSEGALESRSLYPVNVTFSGAHGLTVGDFVGAEGLSTSDVADGISYESHNKDHDGSVAVTVRGVFDTTKLVGSDAVLVKFLVGARVRDGLLLFRTY